MQPKISVIVPCYNQARYLDECLQSVFNQTFENWECIIINDGSLDNTDEIANSWAKKDKRFIYLTKENGGVSSARNLGLNNANGQWIQFLDGDDKIANTKFEDSAIYFEHYDIVISNFLNFREEKLIENNINFSSEVLNYENLLVKWNLDFVLPIHCPIFKKTSSLFDENLKANEDWVFWLDYFKKKPKYKGLKNAHAFYRRHSNNTTGSQELMMKNEELAFKKIISEIDNESLKLDFFLSRLAYKDKQIKLKNSQIDSISKKLFSKRYLIIDKVLKLLGK